MQRTFPPRLSLDLNGLSADPDFLSQHVTPVITTPLTSTSTPRTPRPYIAPTHVRRKTYAGDLAAATRSAIHEYEERIALLESQNTRISVELNATRDALVDEREDRRIERQSLTIPKLSDLSTRTGLDSHIDEQSELLYERKLRMEILGTLKKIRAQNMTLSQSLRESQDNYASLSSILEADKREKEELQEEIKELSQRNFTLYEHNKLLAGRDTVLQEEISSLITKSQADDWMRSVLEEELRKQRSKQPSPDDDSSNCASRDTPLTQHIQHMSAPTTTLEHQGPLRTQLVAARDEVHIARRCLEVSEKRCEELENRVSSLQHNMTQCLDSSAQALDLERELRAEVEAYSRSLEEEITLLKDEIHSLQVSGRQKNVIAPEINSASALASFHDNGMKFSTPVALFKPRIPRSGCGDIQSITVNVKNVTLSPVIDDHSGDGDIPTPQTRPQKPLLDQQLRISSTEKISRRRSTAVFTRTASFSSLASPAIVNSTMFQSMVITPPTSPRGTVAPERDDSSVASVLASKPTHYSRYSLSSDCLTGGTRFPAKRDTVVLKPLQLGSSVDLKFKCLTLRTPSRPTSEIYPSPVLPPVPPSTPKKDQAVQNEREHCFRDDFAASSDYPGSPDSSSFTLVASAPASAHVEKKTKSTKLMATTLLKNSPMLKAATTLFLDMQGEREKYQLSEPVATHVLSSSPHMRRASKVLAGIAKKTGIRGLEDWFIV